MASLISSLWNRFYHKQDPLTVMAVGLDNSGKTSLLGHLKSTSPNSRKSSSSANSSKTIDTRSHCLGMSDTRSLEHGPSQLNDEEPLFTEPAEITPIGQCSSFCSFNQNEKVSPTIGYTYDRIQYKGHTINVLDFSGQSKYRSLWEEFYNSVDAIVFVIDSSDLIRLVVARDELENMLSHPYFSSLDAATGPNKAAGANDSKLAFQMAQKQLVISQGKLLQSPLEEHEDFGWKGRRSGPSGEQAAPPPGRPEICRRRSRIPILFLANKADLTNAAASELIAQTLNLAELARSRHPWHIQATSAQTSQGVQEGFDWLLEELLRQAARSQAAL